VTKRLGGFPIETLRWTLAKKRKIVQPQNKKKKKRLERKWRAGVGGRGRGNYWRRFFFAFSGFVFIIFNNK
jgi:hypothetical protein